MIHTMTFLSMVLVAEANPIKQGLKRSRYPRRWHWIHPVAEANPIKQGLKPSYGFQ